MEQTRRKANVAQRVPSCLLLVLLLLALALAACDFGPSAETVPVDLNRVDTSLPLQPAYNPSTLPPLRAAVGAMVSPRETYTSYRQLMEFVSERLERKLEFIQRKTYAEVNELFLEGGLDLAFICSGPFAHGLRSINNLTFALDQLENLIELVRTAEPLLKVTIPAIIASLDRLERKGLFAVGLGMIGALERVAERHGPEELARLGDVLTVVLDAGCRLTNPQSLRFLEQALSAPSRVDLDQVREVTLGGLFKSMRDPRVRQGLGVLLELTRAMAPVAQKDCPLPSDPKSRD